MKDRLKQKTQSAWTMYERGGGTDFRVIHRMLGPFPEVSEFTKMRVQVGASAQLIGEQRSARQTIWARSQSVDGYPKKDPQYDITVQPLQRNARTCAARDSQAVSSSLSKPALSFLLFFHKWVPKTIKPSKIRTEVVFLILDHSALF